MMVVLPNLPKREKLAEPTFNELSPDLRYRLVRRRRVKSRFSHTLIYAVAVALATLVVVPPLNAAADQTISKIFKVKKTGKTAAPLISPEFAEPVQKGENISGYVVTSGYGFRDTSNLPAGASANHLAIDLATPEGTPIKAIGKAGDKVKVRCFWDDGGGGQVAEMEPTMSPGLWFQALHLEKGSCKEGIWQAGTVVAQTGGTGIGAPHLDWRQRDRSTSKHQHPQKAYVLWALTGKEPNSNLTQVDILRSAIIGQESNGDAAIVNQDSGALGLGQVMPDNLAGTGQGWDYEALGRDLTPDQFLADPDAQIKIINHQLSKTFDAEIASGKNEQEAVRRTAATWYSGSPDNANDTTAQTYGAGNYPSVKDYSDGILDKVETLQQTRLKELDKK